MNLSNDTTRSERAIHLSWKNIDAQIHHLVIWHYESERARTSTFVLDFINTLEKSFFEHGVRTWE